MVSFNWIIHSLERTNDSDQGVIRVNWRLTASDQMQVENFTDGTDENGDYAVVVDGFKNVSTGVEASVYGTESFTPDPSAEGFVAYADLTPEIVVGWVEASWGEEKLQQVKDALQAKIDAQKNPPTVVGTPW